MTAPIAAPMMNEYLNTFTMRLSFLKCFICLFLFN